MIVEEISRSVLEDLVYQYRLNHFKNEYPKVIILHPFFYYKLLDEFEASMYYNYSGDGKLSFQGIEIIRSVDIQKTEIRIY